MTSVRFWLGSHVALVLLLGQPCLGGDVTFLTEHPGPVSVTADRAQTRLLKLSAKDAAAFNANLERLRGLLLAQPVFNPPLGFKAYGVIRADPPFPPVTKNVPAPGDGHIYFHFAFLDQKTGKPSYICCTTDEIQVYINQPGEGFDTASQEDRWRYYNEPKQTATLGGFPVYRDDRGNEIIVLHRGAKPLWVPVTREEYVKMWIRKWEEEAAKNAHNMIFVERNKAMLARMPAEERQMQARKPWVGWSDTELEDCDPQTFDPYEAPLVPAGCLAGRPIVKPNPNLFDPSLPGSAFQLMTFRFYFLPLDPDHPGPTEHGDISPYRVWEALHRSDWSAIGAALSSK